MQRVGFKMKLLPGFEKEYKKRHDEIWPDLQALLSDTGIRNYSIFLDEETNTLFASLTISDHKKLNELPAQALMQKWWIFMQDIMETNPDHSPVSIPLKELFYMA
jgi:L-rhamnose mutarotase